MPLNLHYMPDFLLTHIKEVLKLSAKGLQLQLLLSTERQYIPLLNAKDANMVLVSEFKCGEGLLTVHRKQGRFRLTEVHKILFCVRAVRKKCFLERLEKERKLITQILVSIIYNN